MTPSLHVQPSLRCLIHDTFLADCVHRPYAPHIPPVPSTCTCPYDTCMIIIINSAGITRSGTSASDHIKALIPSPRQLSPTQLVVPLWQVHISSENLSVRPVTHWQELVRVHVNSVHPPKIDGIPCTAPFIPRVGTAHSWQRIFLRRLCVPFGEDLM